MDKPTKKSRQTCTLMSVSLSLSLSPHTIARRHKDSTLKNLEKTLIAATAPNHSSEAPVTQDPSMKRQYIAADAPEH